MTFGAKLQQAGMSAAAARTRDEMRERVLEALEVATAAPRARAVVGPASVPAASCVELFVPGRIEVLGKHTDYAGGRSLVCAVERGFVAASVPRRDDRVRVIDVAGGRVEELALDPRLAEPVAAWARYPATVFRRVARNFPGARTGADIAFLSDLPLASGMSSSSAFMVTMFLAVARVNRLDREAAYQREIATPEELAGFLATVENGQSFGSLSGDRGVGTFGGSEDHTAMLCGRAGELSQYAFCPVRHERQVPCPVDHVFVVAVSGVTAEKTGAAKDAYNRASIAVAMLLDAWNATAGRSDLSLAAAVSNGAAAELPDLVRRAAGGAFTEGLLRARFQQFVEESGEIVPAAGDALAAGDLRRFGVLVDRSQHLAERLLGNQVAETVFLAASARELGAAAASAFGAGFGGSVWALVPGTAAEEFMGRWRARYAAAFPEAASRAAFLATCPGPSAQVI